MISRRRMLTALAAVPFLARFAAKAKAAEAVAPVYGPSPLEGCAHWVRYKPMEFHRGAPAIFIDDPVIPSDEVRKAIAERQYIDMRIGSFYTRENGEWRKVEPRADWYGVFFFAPYSPDSISAISCAFRASQYAAKQASHPPPLQVRLNPSHGKSHPAVQVQGRSPS